MSLVVLLPYSSLLHLIKNVIARFFEQTLLQSSTHQPLVVAESLNFCLIYSFLMMTASFAGDLLHLNLDI